MSFRNAAEVLPGVQAGSGVASFKDTYYYRVQDLTAYGRELPFKFQGG